MRSIRFSINWIIEGKSQGSIPLTYLDGVWGRHRHWNLNWNRDWNWFFDGNRDRFGLYYWIRFGYRNRHWDWLRDCDWYLEEVFILISNRQIYIYIYIFVINIFVNREKEEESSFKRIFSPLQGTVCQRGLGMVSGLEPEQPQASPGWRSPLFRGPILHRTGLRHHSPNHTDLAFPPFFYLPPQRPTPRRSASSIP